jgi:anaerobic magnesium-protoporphyrin IX monomethyl ester cyclase
MNILLLSMPDSFEHMPSIVIRMPNGGLSSLAGNIDPHHRVAVADLILVQHRVRATVERLVHEFMPDVVGLSVMTFQRHTARKIIQLVRALRPGVRVVAVGYDPSLAPEAYVETSGGAVDFIVRGEAENTFSELLQAIENGGSYEHIPGLSFCDGDQFRHNPVRPVNRLEGSSLRLPKRAARVLSGYTMLGRPVDVIETSRGCTFDCSFCSIIEMRGRNFHTFALERVVEDIRDAHHHGAKAIFFVDDNITLNVPRFEALSEAVLQAGLHHLDYYVQAMTSAIANRGARLAPLMRRAGFRYVTNASRNTTARPRWCARGIWVPRRSSTCAGKRNAG